jgi:Flp pilus assembly pilin Flp
VAAPGERNGLQTCPCLYSADAPLCRADLEALHVPPRAYLETVCRRTRHRKCPLYRTWLQTLSTTPDASKAPAPDGTRLAPTNGHAGRDDAKARKEELMLAVLKKLLDDERAQDLAEYGIALTVVGIGAALAATALVTNVHAIWTAASTVIAAASGG